MATIEQVKQAFRIPSIITIRKASDVIVIPDSGVVSDAPIYYSQLGTPVFSDITFKAVQYTDNAGNVINTTDLTYAAVLLSVDQAKKIIKTEIQGRNGTVKEYIGMDDYSIKVQGIITGGNGIHPRNEIASLKRMLDAPVPIPVISAYLQNLGINNAVVQSYSFAQEEGGMSYQTFSIDLLSDEPQDIVLSA